MKRFVLIVLFVVFLSPAVFAMPINILSESHQIKGHVGTDNNETTESYDLYSDTSVSYALHGTGLDYDGTPMPSESVAAAGDFKVKTWAGGSWQSDATAETTYIFSTTSEYLNFNFSGLVDHIQPYESIVMYSLIDLSIDETLIDEKFGLPHQLPDYEPGEYANVLFDYLLQIDSSHTYALNLYAFSYAGDNGRQSVLQCNIADAQPVPEPVSVILLLTGMVGFGIKRGSKLSKN